MKNFTLSYWLDGCTIILSLSSYEPEVDKLKKFLKYFSFKVTASFYYVFLYLACFVVSTYEIFIWVIWVLMAYVQQQMTSSTTYLFTRLQKTSSSCESEEEWQHAVLYKYNRRQTELFHMKRFNGG